MKQLATLLAAVLILASTVQAQDRYYHSDGRKIPIQQSERWKVIQIPERARSALIRALSRRSRIRLRRAVDPERGFYWLEVKDQQALGAAGISHLARQVPVQRTIPAFFRVQRGDTTHFIMTDEFRVQFKPGVSRAEIDALNEKYGVEVVPSRDKIDKRQAREQNIYLLRVTRGASYNALQTANLYYENPLTVWSLPNFRVNYRSEGFSLPRNASDPLYDQQYYLSSTSSNLGTPDVDIDAPEAWSITKGSSSITVAVVGDGVEMHEDFYSGQVVSGTTAGGGDGSPRPGDAHGQAVAGIIAANHNSIGVRGVAPNVKIMPIKMLNVFASDEEIADAIDYAWQHGADVLNNSWGARSEGYYDDGIAAALIRARDHGRGGKGSVVVVSAGNNGSYATFPATLPGVLVVGAVDKNDSKWYYSPPDDEVDIVAPSGDVNLQGDVRTMDRMGSIGYEYGNYTARFGGTSAAAPQAAGVAALVLSENPDLSEREVRLILKNTADEYGSTNWDGSGRLDADAAVEEATSPPPPPDNFHHARNYPGAPVRLDWNAAPRADYYEIYRDREDIAGSFRKIATTEGTAYTDFYTRVGEDWTGIAAYYAMAVNEYGSSGASNYAITPIDDGRSYLRKEAAGVAVPDTFALRGNAPNPFAEQTTIRFALPEAAHVRIVVYDVMGRAVIRPVDERLEAGYHTVQVDASALASGVYVYRMTAGEKFAATGRMVVVR